MFLSKMVNDFITTINSSNQQQSSEKPQQNPSRTGSSNNKTNKKLSKSKKSNTKNPYNVLETDQLPGISTKREINLVDHPKTSSKSVAATKVKSGSWKRSEKSIAPINTFNANKKHKTLRKKSPNWLKFSNSKIKKQDWNQPVTGSESTSACRPGTLYSDVLFSAGCSNLVKIKNTTVNNTSANAQKKLTKALFKFNGVQDNETSDDSEIEGKKKLFPALQKIKNKIYSSSLTNDNNNINNNNNNNSSNCEKSSVEKISNNRLLNTSTTSPIQTEVYEEPDVVILSDFKGLSLIENNMSYGKYLEQHFQQLNGKVKSEAAPSSEDKEFSIASISNIPKWNFMNVETGSSDAFPKFLCQFDDENYLKAEKMALLGLKLALGNYSQKNK